MYRRSLRRGFEFTLMVVGESGLGKSTLVSQLINIKRLVSVLILFKRCVDFNISGELNVSDGHLQQHN